MATKYNVWIDSPTTGVNGSVYTQAQFAQNAQRIAGYEAGTPVPSKMLNTILRQTSLITTALMEAFCSSSTVDLMSSLSQVTAALKAGISAAGSGGDYVTNEAFDEFLSGDYASFKSSTNSSISTISTNVNGLLSGTKIAGKATGDQSGNNIKATYGASLAISNNTVQLKNKNGAVISSAALPSSTGAAAGVIGTQSFIFAEPNVALSSATDTVTPGGSDAEGVLTGKYVRVLVSVNASAYTTYAGDEIVPFVMPNDWAGGNKCGTLRYLGTDDTETLLRVIRNVQSNTFVARGQSGYRIKCKIIRIDTSDLPF